MSAPVTIEVLDGVADIVMCRGERGNAIDLDLARGLRAAARTCQGENVRAVLLRGEGRSFCVGGDLREFSSLRGEALKKHLTEVTDALHGALRIFALMDAPLVAQVQGAVAGAGVGLAAAADLTVAADDATFVLAYTGIGYSPDAGVTWSLPRLVGPKRALELLLTNRRISAREAADLGLVTSVVAAGRLPEEARRMATALTLGATKAIGATRRLVSAALSGDLDRHLDREARSLTETAASPEGVEGVAAFLGKRPALFSSPRPTE
ncbi:enoyl-CoA hydratase/isomerase family protein [Nonomuraea guangzhouensis]|uniref:Enoyl-CoA hydratase/isomerase family protein n=1 Tax=Nonomuraea guangzhouensis TaxID=1291555 RepID=A0ABW4GAI2_9ACTN|nr:enoyl-CoA hydratase-related protein [Nonomuraea guangzhouensis]